MTTPNPAHATQDAATNVVETPAQAEAPKADDQVKATQDQTQTETKPQEVKEEAKPQEKIVLETYELKLGEGSLMKQSDVDRIASEAKERKLSQEEAQGLLDREQSAISSFQQAQMADFYQKVEGWKQDVLKDPELGGDNFAKNSELSLRAMKKFGTPALQEFMDKSGFGNQPDLFRSFAKLGKEIGDDEHVVPGAQSGGPQQTREDILYPTMKKK